MYVLILISGNWGQYYKNPIFKWLTREFFSVLPNMLGIFCQEVLTYISISKITKMQTNKQTNK